MRGRELGGRALVWIGILLCALSVIALPFPTQASLAVLVTGLFIIIVGVMLFPPIDELL